MTEPTDPPAKTPRHRTQLLITAAGLIAAFYAIVLNLVPVAPDQVVRSVVEALVFAVVAITCGVYVLRRGQRFLAIAMIGPSVFILAESGMRLVYFLQHGRGI